tara:strand:+ start:897 stop:1757 length:861 start_codon:yes stop_codon:yes gene_type:complete
MSKCKICNSHNVVKKFVVKDFFLTKESFVIKKCKECSFLFTDPVPNKFEIAKYYESSEYLSHNKNKSIFSLIYSIIKKINLAYKSKKIYKHCSPEKILDIGCGSGDFLKKMQQKGHVVFGVENNKKAFEMSKKITENVFSSINELSEQKTKFDLITFWHSIEHIHDVTGFFKKCLFLLKEKGTIVIAVPNHESYDAIHYKKHWAAYDVPRHLYHFNKKSMSFFVQKFNLKISAILPLKYDSYFVSLMSEKYKKSYFGLIKGFFVGFLSNLKSKGDNHSSLIYIIKK